MFTLGTAAKATGKSKSTILRAIKSGRMSATKNAAKLNEYNIDPAELFRVFDPLRETVDALVESNDAQPTTGTGDTALQLAALSAENAVLREYNEDLKQRLNIETEDRRKLTLLLTHDHSATMPPVELRSRWFMPLVVLLVLVSAGAVLALRMGWA